MKNLINGKNPEFDLKANGVNATEGMVVAQYVMISAFLSLLSVC